MAGCVRFCVWASTKWENLHERKSCETTTHGSGWAYKSRTQSWENVAENRLWIQLKKGGINFIKLSVAFFILTWIWKTGEQRYVLIREGDDFPDNAFFLFDLVYLSWENHEYLINRSGLTWLFSSWVWGAKPAFCYSNYSLLLLLSNHLAPFCQTFSLKIDENYSAKWPVPNNYINASG